MTADVHTEHCCVRHGCKYGNEDCTVATKAKPQSYGCETCSEMKQMMEEMDMTPIGFFTMEGGKLVKHTYTDTVQKA